MEINIELNKEKQPKNGDVLVTTKKLCQHWILISSCMDTGEYIGIYLNGAKEISCERFTHVDELIKYYTQGVDNYKVIDGDTLVLSVK